LYYFKYGIEAGNRQRRVVMMNDWHLYLIWLAIASGITFFFYGFDKAQSKTDGWRVPEVILHGLALTGGFIGGWAGRSIFRHKTKKGFFTFILVISTVVHLGLGYWLIFTRHN
jgi:uncharacterized membrane protein YsdA (DUF1294 family)